jgi:hypothetical protein
LGIRIILGTPIGFDITDWTLSPTRMKADRARSTNRTDYDEPITNEADNQNVHINRQFIETSEKEHPSFGSPDNDDIYINLLFLYCLRRYGIDVEPVTVAHEWDARIRQVWHANECWPRQSFAKASRRPNPATLVTIFTPTTSISD